jgi:hypothetical protein
MEETMLCMGETINADILDQLRRPSCPVFHGQGHSMFVVRVGPVDTKMIVARFDTMRGILRSLSRTYRQRCPTHLLDHPAIVLERNTVSPSDCTDNSVSFVRRVIPDYLEKNLVQWVRLDRLLSFCKKDTSSGPNLYLDPNPNANHSSNHNNNHNHSPNHNPNHSHNHDPPLKIRSSFAAVVVAAFQQTRGHFSRFSGEDAVHESSQTRGRKNKPNQRQQATTPTRGGGTQQPGKSTKEDTDTNKMQHENWRTRQSDGKVTAA